MNPSLEEKLSSLLERLALEIVLAQPDSDAGQFPILDLLGNLRDESDGVAEAVDFHELAKPAADLMTAIVESGKPFTAGDLDQLNEILPQLQELFKTSRQTSGAPSPAPPATRTAAPEKRAVQPAVAPAEIGEEVPITINIANDGELLREYITECHEHLEFIEQGVLVLEENPTDAETLNTIFRAFHTLKGGAGFLNLVPVNRLAHALESLLDLAREGRLQITRDIIDLILKGADALKLFVTEIEAQLEGKKPVAPIVVSTESLKATVHGIVQTEQIPPADAPSRRETKPQMTAEEIIPIESPAKSASAPGAAARPVSQPSSETAPATAAATDSGSLIKVATHKLDGLVDLVGELVIAQSLVTQDANLTAITNAFFTRNLAQMVRITKELQRISMSLRMVPIRGTFQKMARIVRDLAARERKQVQLLMSGEDTELDRNVVEALNDPIMHMIRNSIDHGIETPEARAAAGKPVIGTIKLSAFHRGGNIVVEIQDDGKGMDKERIRAKAIEKGLTNPDADLTEEDIFSFILAPGFSTAEKITDISGRGVGMDVVRQNLEKLRGRIDIESTLGTGSMFTIALPLTLAIIDGLVLGVGEHRYILPALSVRESFRPTKEMISTVQGRGEVVNVRGQLIPLLRLYDYFAVRPDSTNPTECIGVVVESGAHFRCLLVDRLINKQEVVIKNLGDVFKQNRALAGAAILGDGRVGLILEANALVNLEPHSLSRAA
jgi:two-component system chemotaxis sensor kinase CheA